MKMKIIASVLFLAGCTTPEQPELSTYGAAQPVCFIGCWMTYVFTEGEGTGDVNPSVSSSTTGGS
jgi:hypothetical protein